MFVMIYKKKKKFQSAATNRIKAVYMYISSISTMPAPLNTQPCSWFFISILNNRLRKQIRKIPDTVYTNMKKK